MQSWYRLSSDTFIWTGRIEMFLLVSYGGKKIPKMRKLLDSEPYLITRNCAMMTLYLYLFCCTSCPHSYWKPNKLIAALLLPHQRCNSVTGVTGSLHSLSALAGADSRMCLWRHRRCKTVGVLARCLWDAQTPSQNSQSAQEKKKKKPSKTLPQNQYFQPKS